MDGRTQNVGRRDRIVRAALTPLAIVGIVWLVTTGQTGPLGLAAMGGLAMLALVLGAGAVTGTCGVYATLGFDTCSCTDDYAGGDTWG